ncbi:MAG TPA: hypothetical protein VLI92_00495 [Candidatus Saccharimonadales bacterium]|nr:hypothetical protein [Candidatus Saccharimonadales bacterium]
MIYTYLKDFIVCHNGIVNKLFHIIGFTIIGFALVEKSLVLLILGGLTQELGHFYQYSKTNNIKYSPLYCVKPQALFAYPIFLLMVFYIIFTR